MKRELERGVDWRWGNWKAVKCAYLTLTLTLTLAIGYIRIYDWLSKIPLFFRV